MNLWLLIGTHLVAVMCGAFLGVFLTNVKHDLDIIAKEATMPERSTTNTQLRLRLRLRRALAPLARPVRWAGQTRIGQWAHRHLYNLLLFVVIVAVAQGVYTANHTEGCGTAYANKLAVALDQRQHDNAVLQAADARDEAAILAVLTPGNDKADVAEFIAAVRAKAAARAKLNQGRVTDPYPPAPSEFCS